MYMSIRPGTDGALALALINVIINEDLYDKEFVEKWTFGFDKLVPHIQQYTPEWAEKITSVKADGYPRAGAALRDHQGGEHLPRHLHPGSAGQRQPDRPRHGHSAVDHRQHQRPRRLGDQPPAVVSPTSACPSRASPWGPRSTRFSTNSGIRTSPYAVMNMVPESIPSKIKAFWWQGAIRWSPCPTRTR